MSVLSVFAIIKDINRTSRLRVKLDVLAAFHVPLLLSRYVPSYCGNLMLCVKMALAAWKEISSVDVKQFRESKAIATPASVLLTLNVEALTLKADVFITSE